MATRKKTVSKEDAGMPQRMDLVLKILQEVKDEQIKNGQKLTEVLVTNAATAAALKSHDATFVEIKSAQSNMFERLRMVELDCSRIKDLEHRQVTLRDDVSAIDKEVRKIQNKDAGDTVITSAHSQVWKFLAIAVGSSIITAIMGLVLVQ